MAVINKEVRLTALKRQKMLYDLHCRNCVNFNSHIQTKWCPGCAIWDEFQKIGEVLDNTISEKEESA